MLADPYVSKSILKAYSKKLSRIAKTGIKTSPLFESPSLQRFETSSKRYIPHEQGWILIS
jgi:hypothetical protein